MVVDVDFAYNTILGSSWLNEMKVRISTFHQIMKFPNEDKVEILKVNRGYVEATKGKFNQITTKDLGVLAMELGTMMRIKRRR